MIHLPHYRYLLAGLLLLSACSQPASLRTGVYVWQSSSDLEVATAMERTAAHVDAFYLQVAHLTFQDNTANLKRFATDWEVIKRCQKPVGLVVRIPSAEGGLGSSPQHAAEVAKYARSLLQKAHAAEVFPHELQIDYDCPDSRLATYATFLRELKEALPNVSLSFTALPSWLHQPEFRALAKVTQNYVLQVHSLTLPKAGDTAVILCHLPDAKRAVEQASRIGIPFRVALPTYRCLVVLDTSGKQLALITEGIPPPLPPHARVIAGSSDPSELARWVAELRKETPPAMTGLIWYRLPLDRDRMNWSWPTFRSVIAGRVPLSRLTAELIPQTEGYATIELHNQGEQPEPLPRQVQISWQTGQREAADAMRSYELDPDPSPAHARLRLKATVTGLTELSPGQKQVIGWIRVKDGTGFRATVSP